MSARIVQFFLILIIASSCKKNMQKVDKIETAKSFYTSLNDNDFKTATNVFLDSVRRYENGDSSVLSKDRFKNWLQWDSVFKPEYKILNISESTNGIQVRVSKTDKRIQFLNEGPVIFEEYLKFNSGKVESIEMVKYVVFHDDKWSANRAELVSWIEENHPDLNGFLYDQTKKGGENYMKAIELFNNKTSTLDSLE